MNPRRGQYVVTRFKHFNSFQAEHRFAYYREESLQQVRTLWFTAVERGKQHSFSSLASFATPALSLLASRNVPAAQDTGESPENPTDFHPPTGDSTPPRECTTEPPRTTHPATPHGTALHRTAQLAAQHSTTRKAYNTPDTNFMSPRRSRAEKKKTRTKKQDRHPGKGRVRVSPKISFRPRSFSSALEGRRPGSGRQETAAPTAPTRPHFSAIAADARAPHGTRAEAVARRAALLAVAEEVVAAAARVLPGAVPESREERRGKRVARGLKGAEAGGQAGRQRLGWTLH